MPKPRSIRPRRSQLVWLLLIVSIGVAVGVLVGTWWGVGAALVTLAIGEVVERVQRART